MARVHVLEAECSDCELREELEFTLGLLEGIFLRLKNLKSSFQCLPARNNKSAMP